MKIFFHSFISQSNDSSLLIFIHSWANDRRGKNPLDSLTFFLRRVQLCKNNKLKLEDQYKPITRGRKKFKLGDYRVVNGRLMATAVSQSSSAPLQAPESSPSDAAGTSASGGNAGGGGEGAASAATPSSTAAAAASAATTPGVGNAGRITTAEVALFAVPAPISSPALPVRVARLSARAKLPYKGSAEAAGWDLYAAEEKLIPRGGRAVINTDLKVQIPPGFFGQIHGRSGLALNSGIDVSGKIIDADFRGNLAVILANNGSQDFAVELGDRIAQLIIVKLLSPNVLEEVSCLKIEDSQRGSHGFGSSGYR